MLYNVIEIVLGLLISELLFYRFPMLPVCRNRKESVTVSIIIPARNEEVNLCLLLQDIGKQSYPIHEVICVDDGSSDNTANVASKYGARLIQIQDKPEDWIGKSWACQKGGEVASGKLLLFLDADVRLSEDGISCLVESYKKNNCVISVQPYHRTSKSYEQFSLFFNLIQVAANGICTMFHSHHTGLYGPVILFPQEIYHNIQGHTSTKHSIVDDLTLGHELYSRGIPYQLYLGGKHIAYRMYSNGIKELIQGWTKNFSTGAIKTPKFMLLAVFLWVSSCIIVSMNLVDSVVTMNIYDLRIYLFFYLLWVLELYRITKKIGKFQRFTIIIFPIYLVFFLYIFMISILKKLFHKNVMWKGRKIKLER